jgi:hypothetical protein
VNINKNNIITEHKSNIRKNNSKFKIKEENSSSNNTSIITEKKSAIQRFKQLQKNMGKYTKKKEMKVFHSKIELKII